MRKIVLVIFLLLPTYSWALEAILQNNSQTFLVLKGIEIPREQLKKHLKSGLHSQFLMEAVATRKTEVLFKQVRTWKIYYDLWDEVYRVTAQTDGQSPVKSDIKNIDDFFGNLENPQFQKTSAWPPAQELLGDQVFFGLRIVLNPVSAETVERVKKWVHQRRVPAVPNTEMPTVGAASKSETTPRFAGLFNEILGYEMHDAQQGAAWKYEAVSHFQMEAKK